MGTRKQCKQMFGDILCNINLWAAWGGLVLAAWLGDKWVAQFVINLPPKSLFRATDTVVHGLIGGFSYWLNCIICPDLLLKLSALCFKSTKCITNLRPVNGASHINFLFNFGMAFMLASIVDLDHIIYDVFQMITGGPRVPWERGYFHFTLPPLLLATALYHWALYLHFLLGLRLATLIIASIISHHVRDGLHHGLWLSPLADTPRLPYWLYLTITLFLPFITSALSALILVRLNSRISESDDVYTV